MLCLTGRVTWSRLTRAASPSRVVRATPIALCLREHASTWRRLTAEPRDTTGVLSVAARRVFEQLKARGASFAHELVVPRDLPEEEVRLALAELVSAGLASSDGFAGLRSLFLDRDRSPRESQMAGRWTALDQSDEAVQLDDAAISLQAQALLRRYGVVCRRLLNREPSALPWRVLSREYRRLEARGEIRGGRFVSGLSGEQFALPEAVERLREVRRTAPDHQLMVISAADPLNLAGIVTAGDRVATIASTRIAYRDGIPLAALEGDYIRPLADIDPSLAADVASALAGRRVPPVISGFVGRAG